MCLLRFYCFSELLEADLGDFQSIPAAPIPPPPGNCGAFACLVSPGGGTLANLARPGGRAFAYPQAFDTHGSPTRNPNMEDFIAKDQQFVADWIVR